MGVVRAVSELLIVEILLSKKCRKELQRSGEAAGLVSGGLSSLFTVENRVRGFLLVLFMRLER